VKRVAGILLLLATSAWVGGGPAHAQDPPPPPLEVAPVDVGAYPQVSTTFTAPPELTGSGLEPAAVAVEEDGKPVSPELVRLPNDRLEVVLVIDTSGSMRDRPLTSAKVAAYAFLARIPNEAQVAVVGFGDTAALVSPMATDRRPASDAIQALEADGETALYDAVRLASQQFSDDAETRKSVVLLSDGADTASLATIEQASESLQTGEIHLDVVELVGTESNRPALDQLATAGTGRVASVDDPSALAVLYDDLAASLANGYRLSWTSSSKGEVEVVVRLEQGGVTTEHRQTSTYPAFTAPSDTAADSSPPTTEIIDPSSVPDRGWALPVGAVFFAVALFLVGLLLFVAPGQRRYRLARLGTSTRSLPDSSTLGGLVDRATASADAALERHGRRSSLNERLEQAGVNLRPGEYLVLALSAIVIAFLIGFMVEGLLFGLLFAIAAAIGAHLVLSFLRDRRRSRFSAQLGDTLQRLAGSLRAGYGLLQAIDALGEEVPEPTSSEFRRLVIETRLGRDLATSLRAMAARIDAEDFYWVEQAIEIHREVGGNLAEVLDNVAATIRERDQVMRQVKTLTAEGRLSAYILIAMPVVLVGAMRLMNPDYLNLLGSGVGLLMSGVGVVMLILGALWFRKLCQLEY
jgi:tight adherence protein B